MNKKEVIKMGDVAKSVNVSVSTVSRVLSNPELVSVSTRKKVLEAIEQLQYKPNVLARNLRKSKTMTILVIVPDITNPFFSKVLKGIESVAMRNGYQLLLGDTENNTDLEYKYLEYLKQKYADGVILLTARTGKKFIEEIASDYPVVLACEYIEGCNVPTVSIDNISSSRKAVEYLVKLGHKRIAHLTGPLNVILSKDRLKGYKQALINNDIEIDPLLIQEGDFTFKKGYNLTKKLIALEKPPTAVFAASDKMAVGAIKALKDNQIDVPNSVSVIGFDGIELGLIIEPALTTIDQPKFKLGAKAMELMLDNINGKNLGTRQFVLNDELIIRDSIAGV